MYRLFTSLQRFTGFRSEEAQC